MNPAPFSAPPCPALATCAGTVVAPTGNRLTVVNRTPRFPSAWGPGRTMLAIALAVFMLVALPQPHWSIAADTPVSGASASDRAEFFESRIRPVLIDHCYDCHNSADGAQGGLAVDHRAAFVQGGDGGSVIVPGDASASRLIAILRHEIEGLEMPQAGGKLGQEIIDDFVRWIDDGALDPRDEPPSAEELAQTASWDAVLQRRKSWWSFRPIESTGPPEVPAGLLADATELSTIDRFLLAKMLENGLRPSPPAEAGFLVRRLFFALTGMPPTPQQARTWTTRLDTPDQGRRDAAIDELVDELLASPHFGERWARHWMDWIRYAESHGSEGDPAIDNAWFYRDYLIRALNADVPYDQLVREHVAGDLLAAPRIDHDRQINESLIGVAHWRMVFHGFAPTDALDERVRFTDDQINAFSKAFLGLTVSCARCHDHKFDPISQQDYYALFGILGSCRPGRSAIDLPERQNRHRDSLVELKHDIRRTVADIWSDSISRLPETLTDRLAQPAEAAATDADSLVGAYRNLVAEFNAEPTGGDDRIGQAWTRLADRVRAKTAEQQRLVAENSPLRWDLSRGDDYAAWFRSGVGLPATPSPAGEFAIEPEGDRLISAIYPSGVYSNTVTAKHAARLTSPDIRLDGPYDLWVRVIGDGASSLRYVVQNYPRDGTVYPVVRMTPQWRWQRFDIAYWNGDDVHVELATARDAPLLVASNPRSWFGVREARLVRQGDPVPSETLEHLAPLFDAADTPPKSPDELAAIYRDALAAAITAWRDGNLNDAQAELLDRGLRENLLPGNLQDLAPALPLADRYRQLEADVPVADRVPGLDETVGRQQPLMIRGNHKTLGEPVPRRFLEAIDPTPYPTGDGQDGTGQDGNGQDAAAGEGHSADPSGRLRLAEDLLRDDNPLTRRVIVNRVWHHLFGRGIVATTDNFGRLGDQPTHPELLDQMANRFAAEGWSLKRLIREIVTSKSWQLSSTPTAQARQTDPDNRWLSHANLHRLEAESIRDSLLVVAGSVDPTPFGPPVGGDAPRRSIYVAVRRNSLDPFLRVFDFPEPFSTAGRRDTTNVPAQSLTLMNDPRVVDAARNWADRVLADPDLGTNRDRVDAMFMAAFGREASDDEATRAAAFIEVAGGQQLALHQHVRRLSEQAAQAHAEIDGLVGPVRQRLTAQLGDEPSGQRSDAESPRGPERPTPVEPIAAWDLTKDLRDMISGQPAIATGNVTPGPSGIATGPQSYVVTPPLDRTLKAKTIEAWVRLDNLSQSGGGVISVQTPDGNVFDAIVFGEKDPGQWLAGSDGFARTESFGGPPEQEATERPVQIAIAYHDDGRVVGYRDGVPYGKPYQSRGPQTFAAGQTVVTFGVRHLPAILNRMLAGQIHRARIYDRALSDDEVAASFHSGPVFITEAMILENLTDDERVRVARLRSQIAGIETEIRSLGNLPAEDDGRAIWADLGHSLFTLPEFIYVR